MRLSPICNFALKGRICPVRLPSSWNDVLMADAQNWLEAWVCAVEDEQQAVAVDLTTRRSADLPALRWKLTISKGGNATKDVVQLTSCTSHVCHTSGKAAFSICRRPRRASAGACSGAETVRYVMAREKRCSAASCSPDRSRRARALGAAGCAAGPRPDSSAPTTAAATAATAVERATARARIVGAADRDARRAAVPGQWRCRSGGDGRGDGEKRTGRRGWRLGEGEKGRKEGRRRVGEEENTVYTPCSAAEGSLATLEAGHVRVNVLAQAQL